MTAIATDSVARASGVMENIRKNLSHVIHGQLEAIHNLLVALAGGGHVLMEDVPGTGKTTLAKALAKSVDARFQRIQFTPDLLPSDIVGVSIFHPREQEFRFRAGPVFTDILLADEINRASPRTQSALLEAMAERQVTVDGEARMLPEVFFVMATQNPIEFRGTYPLPEAQLDRFAMSFSLGYVSREEETELLESQSTNSRIHELPACASLENILDVRSATASIRVTTELRRYIVDLCAATRTHAGVRLGASPRAALDLQRAAQASALLAGRKHVVPDDIQSMAIPVVSHRISLDSNSRFNGGSSRRILEEVIRSLPVPR